LGEEHLTVNFEGELVALGPLRRDLIPTYHRWHNYVETSRTFGLRQPLTLEQEEDRINELATSDKMVIFTIYERSSWSPIGTTYLTDINYRQRRAEFGLMIGEPDQRGKGSGTEATRLMLDYAFTVLGLHSVMLTVFEYNLAGKRTYDKAGFKEFGRRRQSLWMGGRFWDEIYMDCLASEFASPVLGKIFVPDAPRS
jgi:RimJ/RimL family protein N-acetyltransferase